MRVLHNQYYWYPWTHHDVMDSSWRHDTETLTALLALCVGILLQLDPLQMVKNTLLSKCLLLLTRTNCCTIIKVAGELRRFGAQWCHCNVALFYHKRYIISIPVNICGYLESHGTQTHTRTHTHTNTRTKWKRQRNNHQCIWHTVNTTTKQCYQRPMTIYQWGMWWKFYLDIICHKLPLEHLEAETKWPPFSRRHFQTHFLEWKCMNFD